MLGSDRLNRTAKRAPNSTWNPPVEVGRLFATRITGLMAAQ